MLDEYVSRWGTNSAKWDESRDITQSDDVISLSVADMDFRTSATIINELTTFASHGIYGYTNISKNYLSVTKKWTEDNYRWRIDEDWIVFSPRIIQAVSLLIQKYTSVGDGVVIQTPLYSPLRNAIESNERKVVTNPLIYHNNTYLMDFIDLEKKFKENIKVMILCSPHNPVGRAWNRDELIKLVELCKKYGVLLISDEVHADFTWGKEHFTVGRLLDIYENIIVCMSPSKTFNIPGLEVSNIIIENSDIREKFKLSLNQAGIHNPTFFAVPALEKAYTESDEWLTALKSVILDNIAYVKKFLKENLPGFNCANTEGTFTMWINYMDTGLKEEELKKILHEDAMVTVGLGTDFGVEGNGFIRINVALPRKKLEEAMNRILLSYNNWREQK